MREILFRAKPDKSKFKQGKAPAWLYGDLSRFKTMTFVGHFHADLSTIGQFTGLCDKNGVKIFEGDLVRICMDVLRVKWHNPFASFVLSHADIDMFVTFDEYEDADYEVIGNVHDNPEIWRRG
jgi:hypothetical protein